MFVRLVGSRFCPCRGQHHPKGLKGLERGCGKLSVSGAGIYSIALLLDCAPFSPRNVGPDSVLKNSVEVKYMLDII